MHLTKVILNVMRTFPDALSPLYCIARSGSHLLGYSEECKQNYRFLNQYFMYYDIVTEHEVSTGSVL